MYNPAREERHVSFPGVINRAETFRSYGSGRSILEMPLTFADLLWSGEAHLTAGLPRTAYSRLAPAAKRNTLSSEHFRVTYPASVPEHDVASLIETVESSRADLLRRVSIAGITINQFPSLEIFINDTTGDFVGRTGQPWWAAAATKGNRIELQPIAVLQRRRVLTSTLRHELVHAVIDSISHGRAPRWLAEGMALYFAGEGQAISRFQPQTRMPVDKIEARLAHADSQGEMRAAYAAAYRETSELIKKDGEASVWRRVASS